MRTIKMNLSIATLPPRTTKPRAPRGNILNQFTKRGAKWQGYEMKACVIPDSTPAEVFYQIDDPEAQLCTILVTLTNSRDDIEHSIHMHGSWIDEDINTFKLLTRTNIAWEVEPDVTVSSWYDLTEHYTLDSKPYQESLTATALQIAIDLSRGGSLPYYTLD